MGIGEIVGGVLAPSVAGMAADKFGAIAPFFIASWEPFGSIDINPYYRNCTQKA